MLINFSRKALGGEATPAPPAVLSCFRYIRVNRKLDDNLSNSVEIILQIAPWRCTVRGMITVKQLTRNSILTILPHHCELLTSFERPLCVKTLQKIYVNKDLYSFKSAMGHLRLYLQGKDAIPKGEVPESDMLRAIEIMETEAYPRFRGRIPADEATTTGSESSTGE